MGIGSNYIAVYYFITEFKACQYFFKNIFPNILKKFIFPRFLQKNFKKAIAICKNMCYDMQCMDNNTRTPSQVQVFTVSVFYKEGKGFGKYQKCKKAYKSYSG